MLIDHPPQKTTTMDIEKSIFKRDPTIPLTIADYAAILRCYLIELDMAFGDLLTICDEGFVREAAMRFLPKNAVLISSIRGACIPLELPQGARLKPPLIHFFISHVDITRMTAVVSLTRIDQERAILDICGEIAFFQDMKDCGIPPHQALRAIHDTLSRRLTGKRSDEIVRLGERLNALDNEVKKFLTRRSIPWN